MMAGSPPVATLMDDAMQSVLPITSAARAAVPVARQQIQQHAPGTQAHKATWLGAVEPLTGIQAFQVVKTRGLLQDPSHVCIHVLGSVSDSYLNLYQHLFTTSDELDSIRLMLVSPELERDDTDDVPVKVKCCMPGPACHTRPVIQACLLLRADGKKFWIDYAPQEYEDLDFGYVVVLTSAFVALVLRGSALSCKARACHRNLLSPLIRERWNPRGFPTADFTLMINPFEAAGTDPWSETVMSLAEKRQLVFVTSYSRTEAEQEVEWLQG